MRHHRLGWPLSFAHRLYHEQTDSRTEISIAALFVGCLFARCAQRARAFQIRD
jgi:hypothetical protein